MFFGLSLVIRIAILLFGLSLVIRIAIIYFDCRALWALSLPIARRPKFQFTFRSVLFTMQRAFAATLVAAAATRVGASKWPLRAKKEELDAIPADFDCAMRQAAYARGKEILPRAGSFESLYYALDLNDPACPPTEMKADGPVPKRAPMHVPAGSVFVAPSGGASVTRSIFPTYRARGRGRAARRYPLAAVPPPAGAGLRQPAPAAPSSPRPLLASPARGRRSLTN